MVTNNGGRILTLFLLTIQVSQGSKSSNVDQYVGCFADFSLNRDMTIASVSQSMTVDDCIKICQNKISTFVGLQNSTTCYCGESYGRYGSASSCNMVCSGDSSQICGGQLSNSVYSVCPVGRYGRLCNQYCFCANGAQCLRLSGACNQMKCQAGWTGSQCSTLSLTYIGPDYVGCYRDETDNRSLNQLAIVNERFEIRECVQRCRTIGSPFAGLQFQVECFCGITYDKHGIGNENECTGAYCCNSRCAADPKEVCGGLHANSVYRVNCPNGFYGPKCTEQCHCREGYNCSYVTGSCPDGCAHGWTGLACNISSNTDCQRDCSTDELCLEMKVGLATIKRCVCKTGYYLTINFQCKDVDECSLGLCRENTVSCDNTDGGYNCLCQDGYRQQYGLCAECSVGEFGRDCQGTCHCSNVSDCHPANGTCLNDGVCELGWVGTDCQQKDLSYVGTHIGIVFGICFVILIIVLVVVGWVRRKQRNRAEIGKSSITPDSSKSRVTTVNASTSGYEGLRRNTKDAVIYTDLETDEQDPTNYYNVKGSTHPRRMMQTSEDHKAEGHYVNST